MQIQGMTIEEFVNRVKIGMIKPEIAIDEMIECLNVLQNYDAVTEEIANLKNEREELQAQKEENESCIEKCIVILDKPDSQQTDTQALSEISKLLYAQQDLNEKDRKRGLKWKVLS